MSELTFLPDGDDPAWIDRWQQTACPASAACRWQTEDGDDGGRLVRLSIVDRKHARRDLFTYETDGRRLLHVYASVRRSIFDLISALTLYLLASGVTVALAFIVFRGDPANVIDAA